MTAHLSLAPATLDREELAELRATVRAAVTESGYPARVRDLESDANGVHDGRERLHESLADFLGGYGNGFWKTCDKIAPLHFEPNFFF